MLCLASWLVARLPVEGAPAEARSGAGWSWAGKDRRANLFGHGVGVWNRQACRSPSDKRSGI
uniref:Secreted protein n=1 Tax=Arundo donax TaxID=35708 RepID=A0A0A9C0Q0_ARUDO